MELLIKRPRKRGLRVLCVYFSDGGSYDSMDFLCKVCFLHVFNKNVFDKLRYQTFLYSKNIDQLLLNYKILSGISNRLPQCLQQLKNFDEMLLRPHLSLQCLLLALDRISGEFN